LQAAGHTTLVVQSAAADRATYLLRPDLGRRLSPASAEALRNATPSDGYDLVLVVGDGLSSMAVQRHAAALVQAIATQAPADWTLGPVVVATQARVALGDEIGALLRARMVAVLIGERPGLSAPDGVGIYLTWQPQVGRHDAQRNCISNVRPEGLPIATAAARLWWLCREARRLGLTGVGLKDRSDVAVLDAQAQQPLPGPADG
jgi:ethanolamine ammonia-lyase small subunit